MGGGFIGIETAATLKNMLKDQASITVVTLGPEPYDNTLGVEAGRAMRVLSEQSGIEILTNSTVSSLYGSSSVEGVALKGGKNLEADLVVVGVGASPNTWFLGKGIQLEKDGGVTADFFLRSVSSPDVFVAGDIASYPYAYTNQRVRTEHISEAIGTGAYAAFNMMDKMRPYNGVPFFWTRAFNKSLACVGVINGYDQVVVDGDVDKQQFAAYYFRDGRVIGASGMARGKDLILLNQAMRMNIQVDRSLFKGTALDVEALHKQILEKRPRCGCSKGKIICDGSQGL